MPLANFLSRKRLTRLALRAGSRRRTMYAAAAGFFTKDYRHSRIMDTEGATNVRVWYGGFIPLRASSPLNRLAPSIVEYRKDYPCAFGGIADAPF